MSNNCVHGTNSHPYLNDEPEQLQTVGGFPYKPAELLPREESIRQAQAQAQTHACMPPMPGPGAWPNITLTTTTTLDRQVGGDHYKKMKIQPWELIDAMYPGEKGEAFYMGTAIAYFMRWKEKGGLEDIKKGIHTLEHFIENMESIK